MNLDYMKLKAAIHDTESYLKGKTPLPSHPYPNKPFREWTDADKKMAAEFHANSKYRSIEYWQNRATLLYSLTAHSRGRLHIKKQRAQKHLRDTVAKTMDDQALLIADIAKEFERQIALSA